MRRTNEQAGNNHVPADLRSIEDRYYLFGMLTAFANRMQTVGDSVFEEITWKQWFALLGASMLQPLPSITQVAGFVGTSHQNMKQLLLRLQTAGLVRLVKDESDLRKTLVEITPAVEEFERKYQQSRDLFMDSLFAGISPEDLATTRLVFDRLYQNLQDIAQEVDKQEEQI